MKFKKSLILASALLLLASCGGIGGSSSSEAPITTSESPVVTSEEPAVTSEVPAVTSEDTPVVTSESPAVTSEEAPVATSEESPTVTSEEPVISSEEVVSSEEPVISSEEIIESSEEPAVKTTLVDRTASSNFGKIDDYSIDPSEVKADDIVSFRVTPRADYLVKSVTHNGEEVKEMSTKPGYYEIHLAPGKNFIAATYKVDDSKDYLETFKPNLTKKEYYNVFHDKSGNYGKTSLDFRQDGVELMDFKGFMNIVDGDTTHFQTMNYGYTVKVRYLGIDTPESTSEIEEWGKTASNFSKKLFNTKEGTENPVLKWVMLMSSAKASGIPGTEDPDHPWGSSTDGNGRNLAFVWVSYVDEPTLDDWTCVNLAMVANGFSNNTLSLSGAGEDYYFAFDKAERRAEQLKLGKFSGEKDENYFYYDPKHPYYDGEVEQISISDIYTTTPNYATTGLKNIKEDDPSTYTPYVDGKTLYRIEGYVTRLIGYAFYVQEQPSYDQSEGLPEAYGLYVFTYSAHPFKVGDHVSICGIFSVYSGTYQMQGVQYSDFDVDEIRNMYILRNEDGKLDRRNKIVPIEVTYTEFNSKNYDGVLVKVTDPITGKTKSAGGGFVIEYGGSYEVDTYNTKYPFYNSSNKIVFVGWYGSDTSQGLRVCQDADTLISYGTETAYSYRFYIGGELYYYPMHPEYVDTPAHRREHLEDPDMMHLTYEAKTMYVTGISTNYISTSGSEKTKCHTLNLTSPADISFVEVN